MAKDRREFIGTYECMGGTTYAADYRWAILGEAEEVVRCRDCRWLRPIGGDRLGESFCCGRDWFLPTLRKADADGMVVEYHPQVDMGDYCSKGVRRDQTP